MIRMRILTASVGIGLIVLLTAMNANAGCCKQQACCCDPWEGLYVGVNLGAGSDDDIDQSISNTETSTQIQNIAGAVTTFQTSATTSGTLNGNATGSIANLFLGYNFHPNWFCSKFVLGAQLEGTIINNISYKVNGHGRGTSIQIQIDGGITNSSTDFTDNFGRADKLHATFALVGRAGYLVMPCVLAYGLVGGMEGNFVLPCCDDNNGIKKSKWQPGWTVGAGLEYRVNCHWSILAEYRYLRFDIDRSRSTSNTAITNAPGPATFTTTNRFSEDTTAHFKFNLGQIGIVYRFC